MADSGDALVDDKYRPLSVNALLPQSAIQSAQMMAAFEQMPLEEWCGWAIMMVLGVREGWVDVATIQGEKVPWGAVH